MCSLKTFFVVGTTLFFLNFIQLTLAKNWAVILIGINYYKYTYAFEAGAYKQYNDLVKNGVDPENIIVISPDSAAFHRRNPMPGLIAYGHDKGEFSADEPVNQYENIKIDYINWDLEEKDFFDILAGNANVNLSAIGTGKVVNSGPQDTVFLYIHTITFCCWPTAYFMSNWEIMYTERFIPFIEDLAEAKHFKNMYIHMHSTDSGVLFDNYLDTDLGIVGYSLGGRYNEFSMCHWNKYLKAYTSTCQGFEHFAYLNNATAKNGAKETVLDLLAGSGLTSYDEEVVHNLYGDFDEALKPIKEFFGPKMKNSKPLTPAEIMQLKKDVRKETANQSGPIKNMLINETPATEQDQIEKNMNQIIAESIKNTNIPRGSVDEPVSGGLLEAQMDCFKNAFRTMRSKCLTEESQFMMLKYGSKFARLCILDVPKEKIISAIKNTC